MGKKERHRKYDPEFKKEVLRLVAEGSPAVKIAEESVAKPIFKRIIHSPKYGTIEKL